MKIRGDEAFSGERGELGVVDVLGGGKRSRKKKIRTLFNLAPVGV
jgi:hypothetical protein